MQSFSLVVFDIFLLPILLLLLVLPPILSTFLRLRILSENLLDSMAIGLRLFQEECGHMRMKVLKYLSFNKLF